MSEAVLDARSHPYFLEFRLPKETLLQQIPRKKYLIKSSLSSSVPTVAPNTTALVDRIRATRSGARIDAPCSEIASAAMNDAVQLVALRSLEGRPRIMFSQDGILTMQWQRDDVGVALIFTGDGEVSIALRRPGQLYAENGIDIKIHEELPSVFIELLAAVL